MLIASVADGQCVCISLSSYVVPITLEADRQGVCISLSGYKLCL